MTCAHHIGQSEKRWHQRIIFFDRQNEERSVREWDADRFRLRSWDFLVAEEATVDTRRLESRAAELARAVRPRERHDDEVAAFDSANVRTDRFHDADGLVPHDAALLARLHRLVRPEVAAADASACDCDDCIGRLD
jgi:hypothetical protein